MPTFEEKIKLNQELGPPVLTEATSPKIHLHCANHDKNLLNTTHYPSPQAARLKVSEHDEGCRCFQCRHGIGANEETSPKQAITKDRYNDR